jgi:hypothetical protein
MEEYLCKNTDEGATRINHAAIQIHALANILEDFGIRATVNHATGSTPFNPSPFVRFISKLWEVEPKLRLYSEIACNHLEGLSQWVSARLREVPNSRQMVLLQRRKL